MAAVLGFIFLLGFMTEATIGGGRRVVVILEDFDAASFMEGVFDDNVLFDGPLSLTVFDTIVLPPAFNAALAYWFGFLAVLGGIMVISR